MSLLMSGPLNPGLERRIGRKWGGSNHDLDFLRHNIDERIATVERLVESRGRNRTSSDPVPVADLRAALRQLGSGLHNDILAVQVARISDRLSLIAGAVLATVVGVAMGTFLAQAITMLTRAGR